MAKRRKATERDEKNGAPSAGIDDAERVVGENVRQLRAERSMTLDELSRRMDAVGRPMAVPTLSKLERSGRGVAVGDLMALARAFDVPVENLLEQRYSDSASELSESVKELLLVQDEYAECSRDLARIHERYLALEKRNQALLEAMRRWENRLQALFESLSADEKANVFGDLYRSLGPVKTNVLADTLGWERRRGSDGAGS